MDRPHGPSGLLTEAQELDLIGKAQAGDGKAEDALIRAFMPLIQSISKRMADTARRAGSRGARSEDYLSDAMQVALTAIRAYRPGLGARLGYYIMKRSQWYISSGGLTHEIITVQTQAGPEEGENLDNSSSSGIDPARVAADRGLLADVLAEFDKLPGHEADVVRWKSMHGLTYGEIGSRLGVSSQRAAKIFNVGMGRLRNRLGSKLTDIVST